MAEPGPLEGARILIIAEASPAIAALEAGLRAAGGTIQRTPPGDSRRLPDSPRDVVIAQVAGAARSPADERRALELLRGLGPRERVIALLDDPPGLLGAAVRDFVLAPFRPAEVVARTARLLLEPPPRAELHAGNLRLHVGNRTVSLDGRPVDITFHEFEVLRALLAAGGGVLSREDMVRALGHAGGPTSRWVDIHIHRLRSKLRGLRGAAIETVRGVGYRLSRG